MKALFISFQIIYISLHIFEVQWGFFVAKIYERFFQTPFQIPQNTKRARQKEEGFEQGFANKHL